MADMEPKIKSRKVMEFIRMLSKGL